MYRTLIFSTNVVSPCTYIVPIPISIPTHLSRIWLYITFSIILFCSIKIHNGNSYDQNEVYGSIKISKSIKAKGKRIVNLLICKQKNCVV